MEPGESDLWPLTPERRVKLERFGELVRRHGAERLIGRPLVRADEHDFPEPWRPTLGKLRALVMRMFWHAYASPEIAIEDDRTRGTPMTHTRFSLVAARPGHVTYRLAEIGKDDVAGRVAIEVGRAFLVLAASDPFREGTSELPSTTDSSLAAVLLGLGVLAANAHGARPAKSRVIAGAGGAGGMAGPIDADQAGHLLAEDVAMLLAVQDLVRAEPQPAALATLRGPAASYFEVWRAALAPHRDELRAELGVDGLEPQTLTRADAPPVPTTDDPEPSNRGKRTFRIPSRGGTAHVLLGMLVGGAGLAFGVLPGILAIGAGSALGAAYGGRFWICSGCSAKMKTEVAVCPGCGGTIAGEIAHPDLRLEREEELDAADRAARRAKG